MILLVEDEPGILNLVSVNLLGRGYEVVGARSGAEALAYLEAEKPELMILDLRLPGVSGWEILDYLNGTSISTKFPVVVMTASAMDPQLFFNQYPCVTEVFIKPFDIARLMSTVKDVLSEN